MKKRILALALAGTTAFSVFGGLNVFAATHAGDDDVYVGYTPTNVWTNGTVLTVRAEGADSAKDLSDVADIDFVLDMDLDDVLDTIVEADDASVVYLYDFFDNIIDDTSLDIDDVETALDDDEDPTLEMAKILVKGTPEGKGGWVVYDLEDGERYSLRRGIYDTWDDFMKGISEETNDAGAYIDYEYLDTSVKENTKTPEKEQDVYNFEGLMADIIAADENIDKTRSSELVYLMQQYNNMIDNGFVEVKAAESNDYIDLLVAILEGRAEEDFSKTKDYRSWTADLEDLLEEYEDADTPSEIRAIRSKLYKEVIEAGLAGDSKKPDRSELKATLADMFYGVSTFPETYPATSWEVKTDKTGLVTDGKYPVYPVADYTEDGDTTAEYDWFIQVYELAVDMYGMGNKDSYEGSLAVVAEALADATAALEVTTTPKASRVLSLEEWVESYDGLIEGDYDKTTWTNYESAMNFATTVLDGDSGKTQVAYAVEIVRAAGEEMDDCDNHTKVKTSQVKALKAAIADAEEWLEEYDDTAAVSKVLAVTKALDNANEVLADHTNPKECALVSEVEGAIDGIEAALASEAVANGWLKTADGKWMYGTEEGYLNDGWAKIGAVWYYFNADGTAKSSEWLLDNGKWYYFTSGCNAVAANWAQVNGKWYYFDHSCAMVTGWLWNNNCWYYLDASGAMVTDTVVDGYTIGADGVML